MSKEYLFIGGPFNETWRTVEDGINALKIPYAQPGAYVNEIVYHHHPGGVFAIHGYIIPEVIIVDDEKLPEIVEGESWCCGAGCGEITPEHIVHHYQETRDRNGNLILVVAGGVFVAPCHHDHIIDRWNGETFIGSGIIYPELP